MIEVKDLRRRFGPVVAVDGISFSVQKGDVLGLLGPNGAGKTTAMRMLACFIRPDNGTASVCGHDILKDPVGVRRSLGYLAESSPAYPEMTVGGFLNFICDVRRIKGPARKRALDRIVPMCSIGSVYHQSVETLSKGYKRRVGLAQALIHDPPVLILDEPTDGLDPNQKYEVRRLISKMGAGEGEKTQPSRKGGTKGPKDVGKVISQVDKDKGWTNRLKNELADRREDDLDGLLSDVDKDASPADTPKDECEAEQRREFQGIISEMGKEKCIIVSTHILEEVEAICSRTIIIARGKVLVDSTPQELKETHHASLDEIFRKITSTKKKST